jgi:hypothetical protein
MNSSYGVFPILEYKGKQRLCSVHLWNHGLSVLMKEEEEEVYSWISWKLKWNPKIELERIQFQSLLNQLNQEIKELNQNPFLEKKEKWIKYFAIHRKDIPTSEWSGLKKFTENEEIYLSKYQQMKEWIKEMVILNEEGEGIPFSSILHLFQSMEQYFKILFEEMNFIKGNVLDWLKEGKTPQYPLLYEYFTRKRELPLLEEIPIPNLSMEVTMNLLEERIISSNHLPSLHVFIFILSFFRIIKELPN